MGSRGEGANDGVNAKYCIKYQPSNPNLHTYNFFDVQSISAANRSSLPR